MKRTKARVGTDPKKPIVSTKRRARVWANKALSVLCAVTLVCGLVPNVALGTNTAAEQEAAAAAATAQVIETKATEVATTDAQATNAQASEAQATNAQATEAQATEAQATEAQKSVAYPAVTFPTQHANGVAVDVFAPEGALPEGAALKVTGVSSEDVRGTVAGAVAEDVSASEIAAVDISFAYVDPKTGAEGEIEPASEISVRLAADSIRDAHSNAASKVDVVHIADTGAAEVVPSRHRRSRGRPVFRHRRRPGPDLLQGLLRLRHRRHGYPAPHRHLPERLCRCPLDDHQGR